MEQLAITDPANVEPSVVIGQVPPPSPHDSHSCPDSLNPRTFSGPSTDTAEAFPTPVAHPNVPLRSSSGTFLNEGGGMSSAPEQFAAPRPESKSLNEHESRVFPDEHSILDDPLLICTPYIVNTKYMVLICTECRRCTVPARASRHLGQNHSDCKVGIGFCDQLNAKFPNLVAEVVHPSGIIEPVFGLAIPNENYTICARCNRGYVNVASWRHHNCRNAGADLSGRSDHFSSLVQTFFHGNKVCFVPVHLPSSAPEQVHRDDFELFKSNLKELMVSDHDVDEPKDYRELNQFLMKEGWIKHVSGYRPSELSCLTAPPKEDEILNSLARHVVALMSNIQVAIGMAGYYVRRLLGKRPT
jgi:hypothetical protein